MAYYSTRAIRNIPMNEIEAIESCLRGSGEGFRPIVDAYKAPLMALAVNILGNREDAEDACQDAFIQAFRNLSRFDPELSLRNWMYTILYRRCLDRIKKRRRFLAFLNKEAPKQAAAERTGACRKPSGPDISQKILNALSAKEKLVLSLWANEDFTAAEIAEVLGCAASTARVTLFNARKKIKTLLEKGHETLGNR